MQQNGEWHLRADVKTRCDFCFCEDVWPVSGMAVSLDTPLVPRFLSELSHATSPPDPLMLSSTFHMFYKLVWVLPSLAFSQSVPLSLFHILLHAADVDCEPLCSMFSECCNQCSQLHYAGFSLLLLTPVFTHRFVNYSLPLKEFEELLLPNFQIWLCRCIFCHAGRLIVFSFLI